MTTSPLDVFRVTTNFLDQMGSQYLNVWHLKATGTGTATDEQTINAVSSHVVDIFAQFSALMHNGMTPNTVQIDKVDWIADHWEVMYTLGVIPFPALTAPAATGDVLPFGTCALLRLNTMLRKHSGRKYLGGFSETHNNTSGLMTPALQNAIIAGAVAVLAGEDIPTTSLHLDEVIANTNGFSTNDVITCVVGTTWRSQRRRQPGVGI